MDQKLVVEWVSQEVATVFGALRDKGAKRFLRAFLLAGSLIAGAYMLLYSPPQIKSAKLDDQIAHAKMMHDYGEQYGALRDQLREAYMRLPSVDDREQWLSNSVRALLDAGKLEAQDFKPTRDMQKDGLIYQDSSVSLNLRFQEFYALVLRIENAKPILRLKSADVGKVADVVDARNIGRAAVTLDIATVIPKERLDK